MRSARRIAACVLTAICGLCGSARADEPRLGKIDFPTSGSAGAQKRFLRGMLLLHSFEYEDAREEFLAAEKIEPGFAMAYWGEAMTFNHPIWHEQDREAALAALRRLAPDREERLAKAPTARERGYLDALESLYGTGEKIARDLEYAAAMRRLSEQQPEDAEAASLYALSLVGTCRERDFSTYMKAAGILETVFQKNPEHPGAVHYLIHCYDDPIHASLGLRAARVYAKIAGAAAHAQHMPSHIFLALGMWEETAASNEASWKVAEDRVRGKRLSADELNFHALYWLEYAYLQQGRFADAHRLVSEMEEDARKSGSERTKTHLARMRAVEIIETEGLWSSISRESSEASASAQLAAERFARGYAAVKSRNIGAAREILKDLGRTGLSAESAHSHGTGSYGSERGAADVLEKELRALLEIDDGKRDEAIAILKTATEAEDRMSFEFGPPDIVKPSHELLGEILLQAGRPREARQQFEKSLSRAPGRALSVRGLARAAGNLGDRNAAAQALAEYARIRSRADPRPVQ